MTPWLIHFRFPRMHLWTDGRTLVLEEYQLWSFYWKAVPIADVGTESNNQRCRASKIDLPKMQCFFSRFTIDFIFGILRKLLFLYGKPKLHENSQVKNILRCTLIIRPTLEFMETIPFSPWNTSVLSAAGSWGFPPCAGLKTGSHEKAIGCLLPKPCNVRSP